MFEYIVLAHNDIETRSILYEILTDLGYKITTVLTHRELMGILNKEKPDFIIIDPTVFDIANEMVREKIKAIDENIKVIVLEPGENRIQTIQDILKILREKPSPAASPEAKKEISLEVNILVVDDETECVELIKNHLLRKGYNVDIALSGEEAILKVRTNKPHIVFLDIALGGMDGIIVLKTIKDIDKSIAVIMTSALADERVIKEALELGANGYLVKPFSMAKLETTILCNVLNKCLT